jgi:lon-related putative ATP-dependent protease
MSTINALPAEKLYHACDLSLFTFQTTAELEATTEIIGQERAVDAIGFAIDIQRPGFNLFVLGEPGSGRHSVVRRLLEAKALEEAVPSDWCYVNNFAEPNKPRLLCVPHGRGGQLKRDMQQFGAELAKAIQSAFESDEYRLRVEAINNDFKEKEEKALQELGSAASGDGVVLLRTPHGFVFAPLAGEEAMSHEEFEKLSDDEKSRIGKLIEEYSERLKQLMLQLPRWRRDTQTQIKDASREILRLAVGHLIEELREHYKDLPDVLAFLDEVMNDVVEEGEQLREQPKPEGEGSGTGFGGSLSTLRYQVNVLVDNAGAKGAPVVYEDNPIYPNLVGRVDHIAQMGTLLTNFTLIKPGALHRANGGYIVLDALKLLTQPYAWEGLKRALQASQVRIESLGQAWGLISTISLEPEPMPLTIKVVLIGERRIYYLLKALDPDFAELFKVPADFENELARDAESTRRYADYLATLIKGNSLRPFNREAVARVIEHAARLCEDAERLTANRRQVADLLQEADYRAGEAGHDVVRCEDVESALAARIRRVDRVRSRYQEEILRETLLISVSGERIGQINGLAVLSLDDFMFAHPVRITATVRVGEGDVIDIERETELGGAIHSKGVMILTSFLGARYSRTVPLSLSASLVFEQSYGPVEGDSASLAELCALLSVLANAPIRQSLAVTGSVNQFGDVQAIGAVNEKIEGFFDICKARGVTGKQGVLIPSSNMKHLMLRDEVVAACADGRFHIYAIETVDEAISVLTGLPAESINDQVSAQLAELSSARRAFASEHRASPADQPGKAR